jgi:hypothetical protein
MAHPSAAAAQREAREQAAAQPAALPPPPPAPAPAPVEIAPVQAAPAAQPAAPAQAEPATPSAAEQRKARAEALKAEQEARKQARAQDKAARHAKSREPVQAAAPAREPVFAQAPAPAPVPPVAPAPVEATPVTEAPIANAPVDRAIIMFSNTPGAQCAACETLKISVAPSGKVLIERGRWTGANRDWRYRKSVAHVSPARAAAFAARVNAWRPTGDKALGSCPASSGDGLLVEWIATERHDRLAVTFACSDARAAEALRRAPDLLGLGQLNFAWGAR